jgi:hypothetical protein
MSAQAGATAAEARAATGGPPAGPGQPAAATSWSVSRVQAQPDGSMVARAESVVVGLSFPGDLWIDRIVSVVTVTHKVGVAKPIVESATTVTGARVGTTAVEIGPDGILAPSPAGLPASSAAALDAALAAAGTTVHRVAGETLPGGASADALQVRTSSISVPGSPQATVVYRLGGAMATVLGRSALPPLLMPPLAGTSPAPLTPTGSVPGAAPTAGQLSPLPTTSGLSPAGPGPVPAEASGPLVAAVRPAAFDVPGHLGLLYLVLLLGGVAAFVAASILRRSGVLRPWN